MTKDWDTVQNEIKELSWVEKKRLDEVRKIMESKHGFKASTRAYRTKLREWGFTRKAPRKATKDRSSTMHQEDSDDDASEVESAAPRDQEQVGHQSSATPHASEDVETLLLDKATVRASSTDIIGEVNPGPAILQEARDLLPTVTYNHDENQSMQLPWEPDAVQATTILDNMLAAILEADSQRLESHLMQHPDYINHPIGEPFGTSGGRFFNHHAISQCVLLQHPGQKLLDIACALPSGPAIWVLLAHGASGSRHPLGTDLALHNAIKNGRIYTVQALLLPGRSNIHGEPGTTWKPILQAVYWNHPGVVRMLVDRGANVNETSPWIDGTPKNTLDHCLDRRARDFAKAEIKASCDAILKTLLNAGADIHARPGGEQTPTTFEVFLQPWQGDPHWISKVDATEMDCLEAFIRKGANLKTTFTGFNCGAPSADSFQHQMLWHSTPAAARLLVEHASPNPGGNGCTLLHEIVGSCPGAKRHPSDSLRDIEALLQRGADPNLLDESSFTPLRRCLERCPAVDILPRLRMLLDGGADPELKHSNRLPPYVLAARTFEEPLRSQIMDFLVAKIKGRQPRIVYDVTFTWSEGYFPIPDEPTWAQVQCYNGQNGDFNANLERMVPDDVRAVFQRACFSVASGHFLDAATLRTKMLHPLPPTLSQKDEIYQAVAQRQEAGLPAYTFDQDFVMILLKPQMTPILTNYLTTVSQPMAATQSESFLLPHQTPIASTAGMEPSTAAPAPFQFNATSSARHEGPAAPPSHRHIDFSMPETTLIRWPNPGSQTRPGDIQKAKDSVLRFRCEECGNGNLLTKAELEKHVTEHEHTRQCQRDDCRRRFCVPSKPALRL